MGVRKSWRSATAALAIVGLVAGGCTTQAQRIGSDDGSDACYTYRVALDSTGNFFAEDMIKGAALGALGGALMGGLLSGNAKGAAIGAVAGAVAGAAAGYYNHLQQQSQDQAVLARSVLTDLQKENAEIDKAQQAFNQLVACRNREASKVRADLKAKRITREVAQARMATLRAQHQADIVLARQINENMGKRSANFEFANEQINPGTTSRVQAAHRTQTTTRPTRPAANRNAAPQGQVVEATASNNAKRSSFQHGVEVAATQGNSGFELG